MLMLLNIFAGKFKKIMHYYISGYQKKENENDLGKYQEHHKRN